MKNIILIGMMGCGKTTCANLLAQKLGRPVADTDAIIVQREGRPISDIFATHGEGYFRNLETAVATELGQQSGLIIATGGGLPLRAENMAALSENGMVFWLNRNPIDTFSSESMAGRPLAQGTLEDFIALYEHRAPIYAAAAHHIIQDFTDPEVTVSCVLKTLNELIF